MLFRNYFFLKTLNIPNPIIMYPTIIIPRNCGDISWFVELLEGKTEWSGIIKVEINIEVPINAPPTINKIVKIRDLIFKPIPYEIKKRISEPPPNIIPLSFAESGKNPWPLFDLAIPASAI